MEDFGTPILVMLIPLLTNPIGIILLISPFAISVWLECKIKKYSNFDTSIATLATYLLFTGLIFFILGIGFTSPLFSTNVNATYTLNTNIVFNNQNLSPISSNNSVTLFDSVNTNDFSIMNITTKLEPQKNAFDFGILGIILALVSLGISITLSAISTILTTLKSYPESQLSNYDKLKMSIIWIIFGVIILLYGFSLSGFLSSLIQTFGIIYLDFGLLFLIIFAHLLKTEQTFGQNVSIALTQLKIKNRSEKQSPILVFWLRDHFNMLINNRESMKEQPILVWVILAIGIILTLYAVFAVFMPTILSSYWLQLIILEIGVAPTVWAGATLYYLHQESHSQKASSSQQCPPPSPSEHD